MPIKPAILTHVLGPNVSSRCTTRTTLTTCGWVVMAMYNNSGSPGLGATKTGGEVRIPLDVLECLIILGGPLEWTRLLEELEDGEASLLELGDESPQSCCVT